MDWLELDDTYQQICAGRLCCLCEAAMPAPHQPGFCYCTACVANPADTPHMVHVAIDHQNEGWSICYSAAGPPAFVYWQECVTDAHLEHIVAQIRMAPHDREEYPEALEIHARYSLYAHMTAAQINNLRRAWQADPRNGYEKRNGLPLGASGRIRL